MKAHILCENVRQTVFTYLQFKDAQSKSNKHVFGLCKLDKNAR
jgi:hypothetical protein